MKKLEINNRRYLGSKYKLLNFIEKTVSENCKDVNSVIDVFAGTGVVGNMFLQKGKEVYFNDFLKSNYYGYKAFFDNQEVNNEKLESIIDNYNTIQKCKENYFSTNFGNTYFSLNDCKKIGYIRDDIEEKYINHQINEREKNILVTSLIYSMDRIANTVGHYDAYRKISKIDDKFFMYMLDVTEHQKNNVHIYNEDSNELIKKIKADLVYIDPPYNSRQYCDAYHLLENVAAWDKPKVYGVAKKMDRTNLKSKYCTNKAVEAFKNLVDNCDCKYILVSYNNTGDKSNSRSNAKISDLQIKEILEKKGKVSVFEQDYNNFTTGKSISLDHKERLFLCETSKKQEGTFNIEDNNIYAKSPLNYTGGKFKLLPQFETIFPENINTFVDFFCGGANVAINSKAKNIVAIDNEKCLVDILKLIQKYQYTEIVAKIEQIIEKYKLSNTYKYGYDYYEADSSSGLGNYNKEYYLKLRTDYNKLKRDSEDKVFLFLTLVIYSFNHQIRFNSKGEFNMPVGKRDFNSSIRKNLLDFSQKLAVKDISFVNSDYKDFNINQLGSNDFCYFDPPYYLGDASYNENDGWNEEKEKELLLFLNKLNQKNIKFALSNVTEHKGSRNDILIDWAIENQYNIHNLNYNYSNSNYHLKNKNQVTKEVLITNY